MAVYVDCAMILYGRMRLSHMMADTEDELRAMAEKVGLPKRHFQGDHFDICREKRRLAVKFGAVEVDSRFLVELRKKRRVEVME